MKILEKYYNKIYRHTNKLLKKIFSLNVEESMIELYNLKKEIQGKIEKPIEDITSEDLIKNKLSLQYCKYRTIDKILSVLSGAAFMSTYCDNDIKEITDEN